MPRPLAPANAAPVLVTGGNHGIGAACVRLMADEGWTVLFCGRDAQAGAALVAEVSGADYFEADLGSARGLGAAADRALELSGGRLSGLVNNAGVGVRSAFVDIDDALYDRVMDLNLRAPIMMTARLLPALEAAGGSIIMIASVAGKGGERGLALYTASKAALIGLADIVAVEAVALPRVRRREGGTARPEQRFLQQCRRLRARVRRPRLRTLLHGGSAVCQSRQSGSDSDEVPARLTFPGPIFT